MGPHCPHNIYWTDFFIEKYDTDSFQVNLFFRLVIWSSLVLLLTSYEYSTPILEATVGLPTNLIQLMNRSLFTHDESLLGYLVQYHDVLV